MSFIITNMFLKAALASLHFNGMAMVMVIVLFLLSLSLLLASLSFYWL